MELTRWDIVLWISGYVGNICLMAVLIAKRRYKNFPWFTVFLANELIQDPLLALIHRYGSVRQYGYTYWLLDLLDSLILIVVIFELSRAITRAIDENRGVFRPREVFWLVVVLLVIGVMCWVYGPSMPKLVVTLALKAATMSTVIMFGLTGYVFLVAFFYGVRFRVHAVAITYGLTAYVLTRMVVYFSVMGSPSAELWEQLARWSKPVYALTLFVWSFMLWLDEPERKLSTHMHALMSKTRSLERAQAK
jgi:hypothetical protein